MLPSPTSIFIAKGKNNNNNKKNKNNALTKPVNNNASLQYTNPGPFQAIQSSDQPSLPPSDGQSQPSSSETSIPLDPNLAQILVDGLQQLKEQLAAQSALSHPSPIPLAIRAGPPSRTPLAPIPNSSANVAESEQTPDGNSKDLRKLQIALGVSVDVYLGIRVNRKLLWLTAACHQVLH